MGKKVLKLENKQVVQHPEGSLFLIEIPIPKISLSEEWLNQQSGSFLKKECTDQLSY